MLHLWCDGDNVQDWRASITDLRSKESAKFADLDSLADYLHSIPRKNLKILVDEFDKEV